jgi:hypothetical protein
MYDPSVGVWLEEDPELFKAGDANLERYVGNDPTNGTDPSGLAPWYVRAVGHAVASAAGAALAAVEREREIGARLAEGHGRDRPIDFAGMMAIRDLDHAGNDFIKDHPAVAASLGYTPELHQRVVADLNAQLSALRSRWEVTPGEALAVWDAITAAGDALPTPQEIEAEQRRLLKAAAANYTGPVMRAQPGTVEAHRAQLDRDFEKYNRMDQEGAGFGTLWWEMWGDWWQEQGKPTVMPGGPGWEIIHAFPGGPLRGGAGDASAAGAAAWARRRAERSALATGHPGAFPGPAGRDAGRVAGAARPA